MSDTVSVDTRPRTGMREEEPPILFLHEIDRHYRQGDVTLDILKGAELAIWPGQSVALIAPSLVEDLLELGSRVDVGAELRR